MRCRMMLQEILLYLGLFLWYDFFVYTDSFPFQIFFFFVSLCLLFLQPSPHSMFRVVVLVQSSIEFYFLDRPPTSLTLVYPPLILPNLIADCSTMSYLLRLDILILNLKQRASFSTTLALLNFALRSSNISFSHLDALRSPPSSHP